uniref:G protein-coupled receptor 88 n=1 Tax=Sinocyclocheilus rhinocerous TaxID=307959 RepID=A0A673IIF4_9TELE
MRSPIMPNDTDVPLSACALGRGSRISLATVYSFMCVLGTVLNLLVIYLVVTFKKLRTASNAFIVNGCVADLLVCAFWMPHEAVATSTGTFLVIGYQAFKEALLFLGITVSLLSHSLIAVNRYVLITKTPAVYQSLYQKRNTEWMIAGSWLISLGSLFPWITSFRYPPERCRDAEDASFAKGTSVSVLSSRFATGTLAFTIIGQTLVVLTTSTVAKFRSCLSKMLLQSAGDFSVTMSCMCFTVFCKDFVTLFLWKLKCEVSFAQL